MLTVADIIRVSRYAVLYEMQRMNYIFSDPTFSNEDKWLTCYLSDPKSSKSVSGIWTAEDNEKGTEADRIEFATNLMKNMIWSLDMMLGVTNNEEYDE